jgi:hypothetical protein
VLDDEKVDKLYQLIMKALITAAWHCPFYSSFTTAVCDAAATLAATGCFKKLSAKTETFSFIDELFSS